MASKVESKVPTKIMYCSCTHKFQDSVYGEGRRMFNATKKSPGNIFRCTVCGKTN